MFQLNCLEHSICISLKKVWKNLTRAKFKLKVLSNFILKPWNLRGKTLWKIYVIALEQCQTNNSSAFDAILKIKYEKKNKATKLPFAFPTGIPKLKPFLTFHVGKRRQHQKQEMVFCYHNCSNVLWEKIVLVWGKKREKSLQIRGRKAENL